MIYYIYFDSYGHPRHAISEKELSERYDNDTSIFLRSMCRVAQEDEAGHIVGHVGTFTFESEAELQEYLEGNGDELTGFYDCDAGSRPYNF